MSAKSVVEPLVRSTRGVLERRSRRLLLEPGVRGVELGHRGVDIFDVEPHLQRDSALLVEADYLEHLVLRRSGTHVGSAYLQSGESQAFASHGDNA